MRRLIAVLAVCLTSYAQVATRANEHYRTRDDRARMARNLDGPNRDERQKPKELINALALAPGSTVADLGTGVGYMLPFLSKAVGPAGRVLAEDIYADFLEQARQKAEREKLSNVTFIQGTETDPGLPENSLDVVLALDAYHHFNYPEGMLSAVRKSLRDSGRFVVVDYYKSGFGDPNHIRLDKDGVVREIEANGFALVSDRDHIPGKQFMLVLKKK